MSDEKTTYHGQVDANEKYHGVGRLIDLTSGNMYEGQFSHGVFHGYGRLIYGTIKNKELYYIGDFETGLKHGNGFIQYEDYTFVEGTFEENELQEFNEMDSDEEEKFEDKKENEVKEVVAPLRKEEIEELILGRIADGIR